MWLILFGYQLIIRIRLKGWKITNLNCIKSFFKELDIILIIAHVEVCSKCHPFYTGKQKLVDTGGRVERFNKRFGRK